MEKDEKTQQVYDVEILDLPPASSEMYPVFQRWLKNHPNARGIRNNTLKIEGVDRGSLLLAIAGGTAPDILRIYHHELYSWIRNGFLTPLDKYIYKDTDGNGKYSHGIDDILWKPFKNIPEEVRRFITYKGHIYALPRFQWIQKLIYRRDLFIDAGIDPDKRIDTFEDLKYICRKLTIKSHDSGHSGKGIAISPNGWLWQGFLYAAGGNSLFIYKKCPKCGTRNKFSQSCTDKKCSQCGMNLDSSPGEERAAFNTPEAYRAVKLWHDLLWEPFTKCKHCQEPIGLTHNDANKTLPLKVQCPHCHHTSLVKNRNEIITGCARACIDGADWRKLFLDGQIAIYPYYQTDWLVNTNCDPGIVGVMPFPEHGGASAYHYYGIYAGVKKRSKKTAKEKVCADMILDFAAQFYVPRTSSDYLRYEKAKIKSYVDAGFYNLVNYEDLMSLGLKEYAKEIPRGRRLLQRMIQNPKNYKLLPISEGYNRIQGEILSNIMLSRICSDPNYNIDANLKTANRMANSQVFMKEKEVKRLSKKYSLPFIAVLGVIVAIISFLLCKTLLKQVKSKKTYIRKKIGLQKRIASVLLLLPAVILILLWSYYPLLRGSLMAFQDVKIMGDTHFVGMENFIRVVSNPMFCEVILATAIYVIAVMTMGFFAPVFLAILLSEIKYSAVFYRVVYYAPSLLGGVVIFFVWRIFFMPTSDGMLNQFIGYIGIPPIRWLENPYINKWMLVLPSIWAGTGASCLIYLAALKGIDPALYEAAEIDGAGTLKKITFITLPCLKPLLIINFVGTFIGAFHAMGNILILTGGAYETNVIGLQIFFEAFAYLKFGTATALAWILGSVLIGFTIYQLNFLRKVEFRRTQ